MSTGPLPEGVEPETYPVDVAVERAVRSLLDVMAELCQGLAHGQTPDREWSEVVADTCARHDLEIRVAER